MCDATNPALHTGQRKPTISFSCRDFCLKGQAMSGDRRSPQRSIQLKSRQRNSVAAWSDGCGDMHPFIALLLQPLIAASSSSLLALYVDCACRSEILRVCRLLASDSLCWLKCPASCPGMFTVAASLALRTKPVSVDSYSVKCTLKCRHHANHCK